LEVCRECREREDEITLRYQLINRKMDSLTLQSTRSTPDVGAAHAGLRARLSDKERLTMWKKLTSKTYRPAWVALGLVAILAIALAFPQARVIADNFLGLFRVQQFSVVQVNPGNLPEQLGSSSQLEYLLANDVQFESTGEWQKAESAEQASRLAGIPVRLPAGVEGMQSLGVQPGAKASFQVDLKRVQAVLDEIGQSGIQLPQNLDGTLVTVDLPAAVTTMYGECQPDFEATRAQDYDPDDRSRSEWFDCTTLVQMPSPVVNAPPTLDIDKIGSAFLQILGMTPKEAAHFSENIDWATTLVVPIPIYGTSYRDVNVDGVSGTFIQQNYEDHAPQYLLMWVKDEIVYALTGSGNIQTALRIAGSLK